MNPNKAFILSAHNLDTHLGHTIILYCVNGNKSYKLEFTNQKIVFFIPKQSAFTPSSFQFERVSRPLKNFKHEDVDAIYLNSIKDLNLAKEYVQNNSLITFEMDIPSHERFLMERFIFGEIEFNGNPISQDGLLHFQNPQIRKSTQSQNYQFKILSLDIETGVNGDLYSIGMHMRNETNDKKIVLMLNDETRKEHDELYFYDNEKNLIIAFLKVFQEWDPDFLVGWHVIGFDLMFLERKCKKYNLELRLGKENQKVFLDERKGVGFIARIQGRVILDGPPTLRAAFYSFKNFKLETVATEILGSGKDIASDGGKVEEIERRFKENKNALAKYNLLDCTLVLDIFDELKIIDLLIKRVLISGLLIDRLNVSTAAFDFVYLPFLHRKGYVAPNRIDILREESSSGGLVIEPVSGLHQNVTVFDFKSLYPSIMRTFSIGPYSKIQNATNTIQTPKGYEFSKTESILPSIIDKLMHDREMAKTQNNINLSQAIKILMNSFYGILGSNRCRFYHSDLPSAITTTGHYILKEAMSFFEQKGFEVIYGDTDSIFIKGQHNIDFNQLAKEVDSYFIKLLQENFNVDSKLECEYEKTFEQLYFTQTRSGEGAAKKKYSGFINGEIEFKGMEFVRSDWTELAKVFQKELYQKFFANEELEEFIKGFIKSLESGIYDEYLVYTKRLSKAPKEYTKNIPVHVKAALKINHTGPYRLKEVSYIMTKAGPEPINNSPGNFDYQHYVEKQLKPIADDILLSQNKSFDSLIVGDQLSLF